MKEILEECFHSSNLLPSQARWWKPVLTGVLVIVFGIAAILLPARLVMISLLDVLFGLAKPHLGSLTAFAALLALVALVAIDGLLNLFLTGVMEEKRRSRIRGVVGIAVAVAAILWPGRTAHVAVDLIGAWAVLIGILELVMVTPHKNERKAEQRPLLLRLRASRLVFVLLRGHSWVLCS